MLNIELKKIIEIMKLYPQKRVSAIGLISMTESQDVYLSFFLTLATGRIQLLLIKPIVLKPPCFKLTRNRERS